MIYTCKPSKISIYINTAKKTAAQIKAETGCTSLINGGLFNMSTFKPVMHLKVSGAILASEAYKIWGYGWNVNDLILTEDYANYQNYISCVCMVRDSKAEKMQYSSELGGSRPRTAIGRFPDGRVWMYCGGPLTPEELQQTALSAGIESALMLDGGGSTQGISPDGSVTASRIVHNYICVWKDSQIETGDKKMKVCIDPGHGGNEVYNCSPDKSYYEHEFSLDMALRLKPLLESSGVEVILTRSQNKTVSLTERATIANNAGADIYVSLHSNAISGGWGATSGLCVYTYAEGGERDKLANKIIESMTEAGVKLFGSKLYHSKFTVLAETNMPACLSEYGFHTNKDDVALLKTSAYRDKLAAATAKGICAYLGVDYVDKSTQTNSAIYRVQVGAFSNKSNANALQKKLISEGYSTIIKEDN
jgi:N-acetylmuramoyl-L-alanine amidase